MTILFDSKCDFCCACVGLFKTIIPDAKIKNIYDLRSKEARQELKINGIQYIQLNTIYVIDDVVLIKSRAIMRLFKSSKGLYRILYLFNVLPVFLMDKGYDMIAKNRAKISALFNRAKKRSELS